MEGVPCSHSPSLPPGGDPKLLSMDHRSPGDTCFSLQVPKALGSGCVCFGGEGTKDGRKTLFLQVSRDLRSPRRPQTAWKKSRAGHPWGHGKCWAVCHQPICH